MMPGTCLHRSFKQALEIQRVAPSLDAHATDFILKIQVACAECGVYFLFDGLPSGKVMSGTQLLVIAHTSDDRSEARLPMRPEK